MATCHKGQFEFLGKLFNYIFIPVYEPHVSLAQVGVVEGKCCSEHMGRLPALLHAQPLILSEYWAVIRVCDVDEQFGTLCRTFAPEVGHTILCDHGIDVVLGMVNVGTEGNDARNLAVLGR